MIFDNSKESEAFDQQVASLIAARGPYSKYVAVRAGVPAPISGACVRVPGCDVYGWPSLKSAAKGEVASQLSSNYEEDPKSGPTAPLRGRGPNGWPALAS